MTFDDLTEAARDICRSTTGYPSTVAKCLWYCLDRNNDPYDVIRNIIEDILDTLVDDWREEDAPGEDEDEHEY